MSKQYNGKQFQGKQWSGAAFNGGTIPVPPVDPSCPTATYATRKDIENIFGVSNVESWADLENTDSVPDTSARICWALTLAEATVNDRLCGGPYAIPFELPPPYEIIDATARLAGCLLYESRGVVDNMNGDRVGSTGQLTFHRKIIDQFFRDVLSDRKQFPSLRLTRTGNIPTIFDPVPLIRQWQ